MTVVSSVRTTWTSTLREIDRDDWNSLARTCGFYSSYDWLLGYEDHPDATVRYLCVRSVDGRLLAGLPVYRVARETNRRYSVTDLGLAESATYPVTVLGNRRGYRSGLLLASMVGAELRSEICADVARELREAAAEALFCYVPDRLLQTVLEIPGCTVAAELGKDASIAIPRGGFDEHLATLPRRRRQKIRHQRRTFLNAGYTIGLEALAEVAVETGPLLSQLEGKYGSERGAAEFVGYYQRLGRSADPGLLLTCRDNGRMVGFCHFYHFADTLWLRTTGFDYPHLRDAFEYFNLCYYETLDLGVELGASRLHAGMGSLEAKVRRGGKLETLWAVRFAGAMA